MLNLEKERVFDFLVGLNRDLDDVHDRLAALDPFQSPDDAFAEVRRAELRSKVMLTDVVPQSLSAPESSVMVSHKTPTQGQRQNKWPWGNHCHHPVHTMDKCWEIHGKPANWQP